MESYLIRMENFEGPLDLLCHLIDKNKMDIFDIKINDITDQYLAYLKTMEEMNLEITSEFIVMASRLIYLKSKSLLPNEKEDEEEEKIDLVQMLIEYKKYKENTFVLRERFETYSQRFFKAPEAVTLPKGRLEKDYSDSLLPQIYADFIDREDKKKNMQAENINRLAVGEKVTIRSKIKEILKQLWKTPSFVFNKVFNIKRTSKLDVVTAFMSLLELSKATRIKVTQDNLFGDIKVTKIKRDERKV